MLGRLRMALPAARTKRRVSDPYRFLDTRTKQ